MDKNLGKCNWKAKPEGGKEKIWDPCHAEDTEIVIKNLSKSRL